MDAIRRVLDGLAMAVRSLRRDARFTSVAVATLALGIGASTAVFSLVDAVFLRPLPLEGADRLLRLRDSMTAPDGGHAAFNTRGRSFRLLLEESTVFESLIAMRADGITLTGGETPERVRLIHVTANLGSGLGVHLAHGREFTAAELGQGTGTIALVSHDLWLRRLGGDPKVLGRPLRTDAGPLTVVGILPPGFRFPYGADVWVPGRLGDDQDAAVFARLEQGMSLARARAELLVLAARLRARHPELQRTYGLEAMTAREDVLENQDRMALALVALVGFFLVISFANVAALLLARAVRRQQEATIRAALGAGRLHEIRRHLAEGLVLAGLGGSAGLLLAAGATRALTALVPAEMSDQLGMRPSGLDGRLLAFALSVSCLTALAAALAPALQAQRLDLTAGLHGWSAGPRGPRRLLASLVVVEIGLATTLLSGAGLLALKLWRLENAAVGIEAEGLLTLTTNVPTSRYPTGPDRVRLVREIEREVASVPGVTANGLVTINPLWGARQLRSIVAEGTPDTGESGFLINHRLVTPGLFAAMRIPITAGRGFSAEDTAQSPQVVILSRGLALRLFGAADPIARRVRELRGRVPTPWRTVVGVAADVKDNGRVKDAWYVPYEQEALTRAAETLHLMVRCAAPGATAGAVQQAVWRVDRDLGLFGVETMAEGYRRSFSRERTGAATVAVGAVLGLILASLGLYGIISYTTGRKRHEIGIRLAIGAPRSSVARDVLTWGARLVLLGLALGAAGALSVSRVLRAIVLDLPPLHPALFGTVALAVASVALLACALPAIRATRVDPVDALRTD